MGMYDSVKFLTKCPNCDYTVDDFQTKDADNTLSLVEPNGLGSFYSECPNCRVWLDYRWDAETDAAVLNLTALHFENAVSLRRQRDQFFALCKILKVDARDLYKNME